MSVQPAKSGQRVLEINNLSVHFQGAERTVEAVKQLTLHVDRGETLAVVGESGSGKSVTSLSVMRLVEFGGGRIVEGDMRFHRPDGKIVDLVNANEATMRTMRGADLGMIFQEPMTSLNPVFTVGRQIVEAIVLHQPLDQAAASAEALRILERVRIPDARAIMGRYPHQLSGGMRQRVMIAMALSCKPALLIADEPTTALDVTIQAQILQLIRELQQEMHMGVIFITHDMGVVAEVADRVLVMRYGRKVEENDVRSLFAQPRHPYTRALLSAVPQLGAMRGTDEPARFALLEAVDDKTVVPVDASTLTEAPPAPGSVASPLVGAAAPEAVATPATSTNPAVAATAAVVPAQAATTLEASPDTDAVVPDTAAAGTATPVAVAPGGDAASGVVPTPGIPLATAPAVAAPAAVAANDAAPAVSTSSRGTDQSPILRVRDLVTRFDITGGILGRVQRRVHAVEKVSFDLYPGETLALVGESGCGKTTTGRTLLHLVKSRSGTIEFAGRDLANVSGADLRGLRRNIQFIFQDPFASLNPRMRVGDCIMEPMLIHGVAEGKDAERRVAALLERVGLEPAMARRWPHEFSGGQRQRICIARALALNPKVVIADESVSALDVSIQAQIVNLMIELQRDLGVAYLFISHDMAVVERISHRVAVMYLGQIVEIGPRRQVFENPQHAYTRKLMEAVPIADPTRRREHGVQPSEIPSAVRRVGDEPIVEPLVEVGKDHYVARHKVGGAY